MSLYHTQQGWGLDWRDEFGRRHRKYVGREEAARRLDSILQTTSAQARRALSNYRSTATLRLNDAIDLYLAHCPHAPITRAFQHERLNRIATRIGNPDVAAITPALLESWSHNRQAEVAPATLLKEHELLHALFNYLTRNFLLPLSPADVLTTNGPRRSAGKIITAEEELRILNVCTPRIRSKILTALDAGLRLGECNRLRTNHLNLNDGTMTVWSSKTRSDRQIPLTPRLHVALATLSSSNAPDAYLFAYGGREVKKGSDALKKIRPRAQVHFRFHDLRHTFATRLAAATPNPHVVRVLLGHAPRQTTDLYVHPTPEECAEAILRMAEENDRALRT